MGTWFWGGDGGRTHSYEVVMDIGDMVKQRDRGWGHVSGWGLRWGGESD